VLATAHPLRRSISLRRARPRVEVGELFSGAGLFGQAFMDGGAKLAFAIEMDPHAAASYARNVGPHVRIGAVEKLSPSQNIDVLVAGPPCQGFSTLGRRDPKDVRNRLCLEIPRWASFAHAQVVVIENVPPFLHAPQWRTMTRNLRKLGFEIATWELDAADFGVPQHRRRSFTIASRIGLPAAPRPTSHVASGTIFVDIASDDPMHIWPEQSELAAARMYHLPRDGDRRDLMRLAPALCPPSWHRIGCQATDVWGRMNPNIPANTLRCDFQNPSKGRYIHPEHDRMISLREGARLQQIPDRWVLEGHRTAITRQIGNGVPLGLGRAVARQVLELF
jgi:DNA (cytosine-5)-methyltransferase 1